MLSGAWMRYCLILWTLDVHLCSRSPQGERGLKKAVYVFLTPVEASLPARGAWIEKGCAAIRSMRSSGRSPQGERGLKTMKMERQTADEMSLPARGAWIENPKPRSGNRRR